jgi:hypothetical protein
VAKLTVDAAAFTVFEMQELSADSFDAGLEAAGWRWCFSGGSTASAVKWRRRRCWRSPRRFARSGSNGSHSNVYKHRELGRRFMLHGVPTWFFFDRGKRLGRATGWHGLGQFEAAVATAREKIRGAAIRKQQAIEKN